MGSNHTERNIDGRPMQIRPWVFQDVRGDLLFCKPEKDSLEHVLGILATAGHSVSSAVDETRVLVEDLLKLRVARCFNLRHRRDTHVFLSRNNSASRKFVTALPRVVTAILPAKLKTSASEPVGRAVSGRRARCDSGWRRSSVFPRLHIEASTNALERFESGVRLWYHGDRDYQTDKKAHDVANLDAA